MTKSGLSRIALFATLTAVGLSLLWWRSSRLTSAVAGETRPSFWTGISVTPQRSTSRRWRSVDWPSPVASDELLGIDAVYVRRLTESSTVVLDFSSYSLRTVKEDGRVADVLDIDAALKETTLPLTDISAGTQGVIWLCNPNGRAVRIDLLTKRHFALDIGCYRAVVDSEGKNRFMTFPYESFVFANVRQDGTVASRFGQILENQKRFGAAVDGRIAPGVEGIVFFAPNHAGYLAAFDAAGRAKYFVGGVEAEPLPVMQVSPGRVSVRLPPGAWSLRELIAYDAFVVALVTRSVRNQEESALDVYDAPSGAYSHSVSLPAAATGLALLPRTVFMIESSRLVVRRIRAQKALALE